MEPMLITREGCSASPSTSSKGRRNFVKWKTPFTLSASTRSKATSSRSAIGEPHVAPALLTSTSKWSSRLWISPARRKHSASPGQVRRKRDALAKLTQFLSESVAHVRFSRGNIYLGSGFNETAGDHFADPAASTGDQYNFAIDVKKRVHGGSVGE